MEWTSGLELSAGQLVHELLLTLLNELRTKGVSLNTWVGDLHLCFAFPKNSLDNPEVVVELTFASAQGYLELAGGRFALQIKGRVFAGGLENFSVVLAQRFATHLLTLSGRQAKLDQATPASQDNMKAIMIKCNLPACVQV